MQYNGPGAKAQKSFILPMLYCRAKYSKSIQGEFTLIYNFLRFLGKVEKSVMIRQILLNTLVSSFLYFQP